MKQWWEAAARNNNEDTQIMNDHLIFSFFCTFFCDFEMRTVHTNNTVLVFSHCEICWSYTLYEEPSFYSHQKVKNVQKFGSSILTVHPAYDERSKIPSHTDGRQTLTTKILRLYGCKSHTDYYIVWNDYIVTWKLTDCILLVLSHHPLLQKNPRNNYSEILLLLELILFHALCISTMH